MSSERIAITGANGLIGQFLTEVLTQNHTIKTLDISHPTEPVDITNLSSLKAALTEFKPTVLIHLAAFTDVTAAWEQTDDKSGLAYQINVKGTQNVVSAAAECQAQLIHLSTSFVFDGSKSSPYSEQDPVNPIEWYGQTKAWAEDAVTDQSPAWTILRIDQPFHHLPSQAKADLSHQIALKLQDGSLPPQFVDHFFGPTYIPDLISLIEKICDRKTTGLFHATNNETWTNYDFATAISRAIQSDIDIDPSKLADYLKTSQRPYQQNSSLDSTIIQKKLDFTPTKIETALQRLVTK